MSINQDFEWTSSPTSTIDTHLSAFDKQANNESVDLRADNNFQKQLSKCFCCGKQGR